MMEFFENLGVEMEVSDMSFAVSLDNGKGCEWGSRNGVSGLFAQKKNVLNPYFWQMIREIVRFKEDVLKYIEELEGNPDIDRKETLGEFLNSRGYSELFQQAYLVRLFSLIDPTKCYSKFSWTRSNLDIYVCGIGTDMRFDMVMPIRRCLKLLCILCSFVLLQPPSSSG